MKNIRNTKCSHAGIILLASIYSGGYPFETIRKIKPIHIKIIRICKN
jgi:hypothetical protein